MKLVGRAQAGGRPSARATEEEVLAYFARYEGWTGLAGLHALRRAGHRRRPPRCASPRPA